MSGSINVDGVTLLLRKARPTDVSFIFNSWLKSYRVHSAFKVPDSIYYPWHHRVIEQLMAHHTLLVVCPEDNTDTIVGWVCYAPIEDGLMIHYMYVKESCRGSGVARKLYEAIAEADGGKVVVCTHQTSMGKKLMPKVNAQHNPYLLFTCMPSEWWLR